MRILAIDLGKNKSVACVYEAESGTARFQKLPTGIPAIQTLLRTHLPDRVVIEICPSAGWVGDLVVAEGRHPPGGGATLNGRPIATMPCDLPSYLP